MVAARMTEEAPSEFAGVRVRALEARLAERERELERARLHDPITGLPNRAGLERALTEALRVASQLGVLLIDLDQFQRVNRALGHGAGDIVLRELAAVFLRALGPRAVLGRVGGDVFLALVPADEADRLAEAARLGVAETTLALADAPLRLSATVAVCVVTAATPSLDEVVSLAFRVVEQGKSLGRNRVVHDDLARGGGPALTQIVAELRRGQGFRAVAQPLVSLAQGEVLGYEILARSTVEHFEQPGDFFRASKEANILTLVDHRCLRTSLAASRALPRRHEIHVNLFPSTLLAVPTDELLRAFPSERPFSSYCVELAEEQIIGDPSYLLGRLGILRAHGIKFAIDDVGFGRTCLENLVVLAPDVVKIDRRVVTGAAQSRERRAVLERMLRVAFSLECEVVVEGVETEEDRAFAEGLGVGVGQGFLWGRPQGLERWALGAP
jgi:diguanylate cyclase (GGDEF)-like protein